MSHDLSAHDVEKANFVFGIYDFQGNDTMDAFFIGDALRALNLNPTLEQIEKLGGAKVKKQKFLKPAEFLPIYSEAKKEKDVGDYNDCMELMRLYDKQENGFCLFAELRFILLSLGEKMTEKEVDPLLAELCDEEDDEGWIPYQPFLERLCKFPTPKREI